MCDVGRSLENHMSEVFSYYVEGTKQFCKNGMKIDEPATIDVVQQFLDDKCIISMDDRDCIPTIHLYYQFNGWIREQNQLTMNRQNFAQMMTKGKGFKSNRKMVGKNRVTCYRGIRFRSNSDDMA